MDRARGAQERVGFGAEKTGLQRARAAHYLECVGERARLLVDLLLHVMAVRPEGHRLVGELGEVHAALHRLAARVDHAIAAGADLSAIAVLQIHDAPRHRQERGDIRGGEILAVADAKEKRRSAACDDHSIRVARRDDGKGERAVELGDRAHRGGEERRRRLAVLGHEMRHDFGVGVRGKRIAGALQPLADRLVVLDDAVVHERDVAGEVRVRIALGRRAVRRPARVGNTGLTADVIAGGLGGKLGDAAGRADAFYRGAVDYGDARRVVAAVLETPQAVDQDRHDVPARGGADDAAHWARPSSSAASSPEWKPGARAPR